MAGRPPSITDIAAHCAVSKATVSKALNPNPGRCDVGAATRERIRAAARELGWQPGLSRHWAGRERRSLGLVYGRAAPYLEATYARVPDALAAAAAERGYQLLFVPLAGTTWRRQLREQRIDAAVLVHPVPEGLEDELAADGFPAAVLNSDGPAPLHRALPDDAGAVAAALDHLHGLGHRRIAWLRCTGFDRTWHHSIDVRLGAYRAWMAAHGLPGEELLHSFDDRIADRRLHAWLRRSGATAVVAYNDEDALRLRLAAADLGVAVPERLSLVAVHDQRALAWHLPPITAVTVPMAELARRAALLAIDACEGRGGAVSRVVLPGGLVVRASTARPRNRFAKRGRRD